MARGMEELMIGFFLSTLGRKKRVVKKKKFKVLSVGSL